MAAVKSTSRISGVAKGPDVRTLPHQVGRVATIGDVTPVPPSNNQYLDLSENRLLSFDDLYEMIQRQQKKFHLDEGETIEDDETRLAKLQLIMDHFNHAIDELGRYVAKGDHPLSDKERDIITRYRLPLHARGVHIGRNGHLSLDPHVATDHLDALDHLLFGGPGNFFDTFFIALHPAPPSNREPYHLAEAPHGLFFDRKG